MKRKFALLLIPMAALTMSSCISDKKPSPQSSYYECQRIMHQLYAEPHRYKSVQGNKLLATTRAKLQKDYRHYDCNRYERH